MKNISIILFLTMLILSSCSLFIDKDETAKVSYTSYKPKLELKGKKRMSIEKGKETYVEPGAIAYVGDTIYNLDKIEIINKPNVDTPNVYIVTYRVKNYFGWFTEDYRTVNVWEGAPYSSQLEPKMEGEWRLGAFYKAKIIKDSLNGYYYMENCWAVAGDPPVPIYLIDKRDNLNFVVAPDNMHLGKYTGTAQFRFRKPINSTTKPDTLIINIYVNNSNQPKVFKWTKK